MNLIPRDSFLDFDKLLDGFFAPARSAHPVGASVFSPRVDIKDKSDSFEITAELPGVEKDDLHVVVQDGLLTIEASLQQEDKEEKDGKIIRQERRYGKFTRSFQLGDNVQDSNIKANFDKGVLTLNIPKAEPKQPERRRIDII